MFFMVFMFFLGFHIESENTTTRSALYDITVVKLGSRR